MNADPKPVAGMLVSIQCGSSFHAGRVIKTTAKSATVQFDKVAPAPGANMDAKQEWIAQADPNGRVEVFRLNKFGSWTCPKRSLHLRTARRNRHELDFGA